MFSGIILIFFLSAVIVCMALATDDFEESLTISRVALPVEPSERPFCVSLPEHRQMIAFQMERADGYGKLDIYFSRFENRAWSKPYNAGPAINTAAHEADAKFSADGLFLLFVRSEDFKRYSELHVSHFRDGSWSEAKPIGPPVSPRTSVEFGTVLSRDGKRLYFSSNRQGGFGGQDFYYSDRIGDDWMSWSDPVNLGPAVNTKDDEVDLAVSRDEQTIIFPAKKPDSINNSTDLYMTRNTGKGWSPPVNLGPRINTPATDTCPWLGFDGHSLYANSEWDSLITGGKGTTAVWLFRSSKGFE